MSMRALRQLTEHVDQQHREAMKTIDDDLGELHLSRQDDAAVATRRNFVRNLGLGGAAVAFGTVLVPVAGLVPAALAQTSGSSTGADIPDADMAAGEVRPGVGAGRQRGLHRHRRHPEARQRPDRVGPPVRPPPRRALGRPGQAHRQGRGGHRPEPEDLAVFGPQIAAAADANALMQIAFNLETGAASTYQLAMGAFSHWEGAATVGHHRAHRGAARRGVGLQPSACPTDQWMPAFQTSAAALQPATYAAS